jgi:hypothetical protein
MMLIEVRQRRMSAFSIIFQYQVKALTPEFPAFHDKKHRW